MSTKVDDHVELTTRKSRQGEGSKRVNWVLLASLGLAILGGVVVYFVVLPQ